MVGEEFTQEEGEAPLRTTRIIEMELGPDESDDFTLYGIPISTMEIQHADYIYLTRSGERVKTLKSRDGV